MIVVNFRLSRDVRLNSDIRLSSDIRLFKLTGYA